ncbi:hypothetical protein Desor_2614 [Desulfosporosinus orientis DSM 765]|uniref:Uncharacterized protein n=1 Tax=Desulfosporosinus orientis (strain ATCC 19365 / DSM 765 / NCIMB 8382 / VKM B-1628 / Singapore I) TaxID=768706 RepID=G7W6F6_DESOD|nr:hypothetical protein [Desulfosporosinus orientis]AET68163.1 hypothetical protein Desor_2614 [Desulfosporosinus orientis DSM 765]
MRPIVLMAGGVAAVGVIAAVLLNRSGGILFHSTALHASFYERFLMQNMFMDANWGEDWPQDIEYLWLYESSPIEEVVDIEASESRDIPLEEVYGSEKSI